MKHIDVQNASDCCGCGACVISCPKRCISLQADAQGFRYPAVDTTACVNCGICKKVCPFISPFIEKNQIISTVAAFNLDERERLLSSSGGIFGIIGRKIIKEGGVVFGAKFNPDWSVSHSYADTETDLSAMLGSKYVQSDLGHSYFQCEQFLKSGRKVVFSGTPCQIAGLNKYLKQNYGSLLLTIEVICHGVPSPSIWKDYLSKYHKVNDIVGISFRAKTPCWEEFSIKIDYQDTSYIKSATVDPYMLGFLRNIYLRPSCYGCKSKNGVSGASITLGDFWGIDKVLPEINDHKGISIVVIHSQNAKMLMDRLGIQQVSVNTAQALKGNTAYSTSVAMPYRAHIFWKRYYKKGIECLSDIIESYAPTLKNRIVNKFYTTFIYR